MSLLIRYTSARSLTQVYQEILRERHQDPSTFSFSFKDPVGTNVDRELARDDLRLQQGVPIGMALMDLAFQAFLHASYSPSSKFTHPGQRHFTVPSMPLNREDAFQWICMNPAAPEYQGWSMMPLSANSGWSLLVGQYRGPGTDR